MAADQLIPGQLPARTELLRHLMPVRGTRDRRYIGVPGTLRNTDGRICPGVLATNELCLICCITASSSTQRVAIQYDDVVDSDRIANRVSEWERPSQLNHGETIRGYLKSENPWVKIQPLRLHADDVRGAVTACLDRVGS